MTALQKECTFVTSAQVKKEKITRSSLWTLPPSHTHSDFCLCRLVVLVFALHVCGVHRVCLLVSFRAVCERLTRAVVRGCILFILVTVCRHSHRLQLFLRRVFITFTYRKLNSVSLAQRGGQSFRQGYTCLTWSPVDRLRGALQFGAILNCSSYYKQCCTATL